MTAVRKRRVPANDLRPKEISRISYVILPRTAWNKKRLASAAALGIFVFIMGAALAVTRTPAIEAAAEKSVPFDITLTSNAPALPDDEKGWRFSPMFYKALPPVFEVEVKDGAAAQAMAAQDYMRQGARTEALQYQRRAVELEPANMLYRLKLAIMHDRVNDREGAAMLYQQVIEAYEKRDVTLPHNLDIESIRNRLIYLNPTAEK